MFIPLSSKVEKYQKIINKKIQKNRVCDTILIEYIFERKHAILLQNAFPTLEKYIDHVHTIGNKPAKVSENLKCEILFKFRRLLKMKENGVNLFFTDIDKIKEMMLKEIEK